MTDRNERRPGSADKTVRDIRRATRRKFSAEGKIRIVLEGLRGEETVAELSGRGVPLGGLGEDWRWVEADKSADENTFGKMADRTLERMVCST